ncbi:MAG: hypothetical protein GVY17_01265 [Cyanobacteria bacterium]|nr:hypothetical protein [Cyanobacteria bacterium GSL.Bin21]
MSSKQQFKSYRPHNFGQISLSFMYLFCALVGSMIMIAPKTEAKVFNSSLQDSLLGQTDDSGYLISEFDKDRLENIRDRRQQRRENIFDRRQQRRENTFDRRRQRRDNFSDYYWDNDYQGNDFDGDRLESIRDRRQQRRENIFDRRQQRRENTFDRRQQRRDNFSDYDWDDDRFDD